MSLIIKNRFAVLNDPPLSGGMADVYKAVDLQNNGSPVAVKIFKHGFLDEPVIAESFRREVQALKELKHPNIIELIDAGLDESTEHNYLAFPWIESNLDNFLKEHELEGWDDYWQMIGRPILEALAFSHEREYIHRDLKPSNILIDRNQKVLLSDFGISKIKSYFRPTITLAEFTSRPFTPPEYDDGEYTYTRDSYGFGVVTLQCLVDFDLQKYEDLETAINQVNLPSQILEVINSCVSKEPSERPENAEVLLGKLVNLQKLLGKKLSEKKEVCYIRLNLKSSNKLQNDLQISEKQVQERIEEDLNLSCGIRTYENFQSSNKEQRSQHQLKIYSDTFSFHVAVDKDVLTIINVRTLNPSILEIERENAFEPNLIFRFGKPANYSKSQEILRSLVLSVSEFEEDLKQAQAEAEKEKIFETWRNILRAKLDWERDKQAPLPYTEAEVEGNRVMFKLMQVPDNDITGQPWHITVGEERRTSILGGNVEDIQDEWLVLYVQYGNLGSIPAEGVLNFDIRAAEFALSRQRSALDAIRYERSVRAELHQLLIEPSVAHIPGQLTLENYYQVLNPSQQEAVDAALNTTDFLIIEGPPGTGKTRFITEVILQELNRNSEVKILLSSQTHVALDNALERLNKEAPTLSLVRLGNHEKVANAIHDLLIEKQMEYWLEEARSKSQDFIESWAKRLNINVKELKITTLLHQLKEAIQSEQQTRQIIKELEQKKANTLPFTLQDKKKIDLTNYGVSDETIEEFQQIEDEISSYETTLEELKKIRETLSQELATLTGQSQKKFLKLSLDQISSRISDSINITDPQIQTLQQLLNLQAEWFIQFGRSEEFQPALLRRVQVLAGTCIGAARDINSLEFDICIIDEASKATATEVLVPLSRAKKWILVGDSKQLPPFQDEVLQDPKFLEKYSLSDDVVRETLFDLLRRSLPQECNKRLSIQHRMVKPIGDLISKCFYEGQLDSQGPDIDEVLCAVLPKPVIWLTTSRLTNCTEQRQNLSFSNSHEVNLIISFLKRLNTIAFEANKKYQVAILTGYTAQKSLIKKSVDAECEDLVNLTLECNTVDAFQGREADLAIFSVTRSNRKGDLGFLKNRERLNVALSRGKLGLVIVGDHFFCRSSSYNPLQDVINHIESYTNDCLLWEIRNDESNR